MAFISALNTSTPTDGQPVSTGAPSLREIKTTLKDTFPDMDAAMTAAGKAVLVAADAAAQRTTLELGSAAVLDVGEEVGDLVALIDVGGSPQISSDLLPEAAAPPPAFPSGTRMVFHQTAAPTGWTKDVESTTHDRALRVTTGTVGNGGSVAFSTVFARTATDGHELTIAEMPSHTHSEEGVTSGAISDSNLNTSGPTGATSKNTGSTGGGDPHNHAIDLRVHYTDIIIAEKDE